MVEVGQESPWSHGHQHGTLSDKVTCKSITISNYQSLNRPLELRFELYMVLLYEEIYIYSYLAL